MLTLVVEWLYCEGDFKEKFDCSFLTAVVAWQLDIDYMIGLRSIHTSYLNQIEPFQHK